CLISLGRYLRGRGCPSTTIWTGSTAIWTPSTEIWTGDIDRLEWMRRTTGGHRPSLGLRERAIGTLNPRVGLQATGNWPRYEDRLSRPVGAHGDWESVQPSPLGWAEESRTFGPNGRNRTRVPQYKTLKAICL